MTTIALWDDPASDVIEASVHAAAGGQPVDVVRVRDRNRAVELLLGGMVDIALVPTMSALLDPDAFDVFSTAAVSSWKFPMARIESETDLSSLPNRVLADPGYSQEVFVARVILQEHYGVSARFVEAEGLTHIPARVVVDREYAPSAPLVLDLGEEWFEMSNYPMVWGVFATCKGCATVPQMRFVRDLGARAGALCASMAEKESAVAVANFLSQDLRFRLDDLAIASVTELTQHLFYYNLADSIESLPLVYLPDDERDEAPEILA